MRLIDADALVEDFEKVYEFYMNEIKEANENPDNYTSKFLPATAGAIDGLVDAEIVINNAPTIEPDGDLISGQAVIELIKNSYYNLAENMDDVWAMVHDVEQLPSAENESRLYIKIYADDEPSVKAEKLYQICGETQNREVAEWLKEYFPSAPDSRQRGEWKAEIGYDGEVIYYECSHCGDAFTLIDGTPEDNNYNFCHNCGADMRGEEE